MDRSRPTRRPGEFLAAAAESRTTTALSALVITCLASSLLLWSVSYRGLYADGSNLLLHSIELHNFFHVSQTRVTSTFLTQLLPVLAIRYGIRSTGTLAMLYTIGLASVPIGCYALAIWITRRQAALFCATIAVIVCCFYPLAFLLVGEGNVYLGLFWVSFAVLMNETTRESPRHGVLLLLLSAAALEVYETSAFFSVILAILAMRRAAGAKSPFLKFVLLSSSLIFLFGALCGLSGIIFPRDAANESGFAAGLRNLPHNAVYLRLTAIMAISVLTAFIEWRALRLALAIAVLVSILAFMDVQLRPSGQLALGYVIYQRSQVYCTLALIVGLVFVAVGLARARERPDYFHPGILIAPLIAVFAIDTVETLRWDDFMNGLCKELVVQNSPAPAQFFADPTIRRYGVPWTFPTMSVLGRSKGSRTLLAEPGYTGWQPFDPAHPPDISPFKFGQTICR
jgi:hypothetical protein